MEFTISVQNVITVGSALGVLIAVLKIYNRAYDLWRHQKEQDKRLDKVDEGQTVIMEALLGILEGQIEQGCNGKTHAARDAIQNYLLRGKNNDR